MSVFPLTTRFSEWLNQFHLFLLNACNFVSKAFNKEMEKSIKALFSDTSASSNLMYCTLRHSNSIARSFIVELGLENNKTQS